MCPLGYHHHGFVVHHVPKCMSWHKAIVVITERAHCFHDNIYIMPILLLWDLSTLFVVDPFLFPEEIFPFSLFAQKMFFLTFSRLHYLSTSHCLRFWSWLCRSVSTEHICLIVNPGCMMLRFFTRYTMTWIRMEKLVFWFAVYICFEFVLTRICYIYF